MKQTAMQKLLEEVILEREKSIIVEFREALDFVITAIETDYKEMEKQQHGYSDEDMEIVEISSSDANYIQHYQTKEGQLLATKFNVKQFKNKLIDNGYWKSGEWKQPPVKIKYGDLVDVQCDNYPTMLGRYIGKGLGIVELYNYATGISYHIGKVTSRGLDRNPRLISDEKLFEFIED